MLYKMNPNILQETFGPLYPINGRDILRKIVPDYKEKIEYSNECIYVGHCEVTDYRNNSKTRPKIGKSRYLTALNRGRSQGGCEWIFDYISFQLE